MEDNSQQDLTSPFITRVPSATSTSTMEIISKSWQEDDKGVRIPVITDGWGPPMINRKDNAWQDEDVQFRSKPMPQKLLQNKTEEWVKNSSITQPKKVLKDHPVSAETSNFLSNMVSSMRGSANSNTAVMSLLQKPVSVFDEQDELRTKDLDMKEQDRINKELEDFLSQIREIRDGPSEVNSQGELVGEITDHLTEQKTAVEDALAALDRELTQDSGVNGSEAEHEDEFKRLVMERESTITPEISMREPATSEQDSEEEARAPISPSETTKQKNEPKDGTEESAEKVPPPLPTQRRMGLYELLALHPDNKVRKAAQKMKRLDEKLKLAVQREKEVKRQRELMNKQILLYNSGSQLFDLQETKEDGDDNLTSVTDLKGDVTPIFTTQIDGDEDDTCSLPLISSNVSMTSRSSATTRDTKETKPSNKKSRASKPSTEASPTTRSKTRSQSKQSSCFSRREDKQKKNNKNFIARNKELATDASAVIAMTEEEKRRLEELLCDVDTLEDTALENTVALADEGGFRANKDEQKRLKEIESLLIVEEGSAMSLCSGLSDATLLSIQSGAVEELNEKCKEEKQLGEAALIAISEKKGEEERLTIIDQMLERLTGEEQEELPEVPKAVLDELLAQCRVETTRVTSSELPSEAATPVPVL